MKTLKKRGEGRAEGMEAAAIVCIWEEGELGVSCRGKRMCGVSVWGGTAVTRARAGVPREEELSASCSLASFGFCPIVCGTTVDLGSQRSP